MTCDCPDFVYRGGKCNYIAATRYYLEIEKNTPTGTVTEKVHLTYIQAWNAYNEAQKAEIDSTGFHTTTFNAYNGMKHGQKKEHHWVKAHLCAGVKTNIVAAVAITDSIGDDSPQFGPLVKKTSEGFIINEVSEDMAYSSRLNLLLVANAGGKAYIPFKKSATVRAGGSTLWKKMFHYFQLKRDEFMDHYHSRSNVEATNEAIKRMFGEILKSKNPTAQVNELLAKIVAYNLTVVIP